MVYLKKFTLLDEDSEYGLFDMERRNIFNSHYPVDLFTGKNLQELSFDNITIFYGGNGSGKTTLLNIIADRINAKRKSNLSKGSFFDKYVSCCAFDMTFNYPQEIKLLTSDDVFDYLLDVRAINAGVNRSKENLTKEYLYYKFECDSESLDNYEEIKNSYESKRKTLSSYVRNRLGNNNLMENSNGESALMFWEKEILENSIYLLDEPENSLSADNVLKLKKFIEESVSFYNCQFLICTHHPFLLNLHDAKIYDLDETPVKVKNWTELANVKIYYDFFKEHELEFKED